MSNPAYRIVAIAALALLIGVFVAGAAVLLGRGNDNAPIQVISPSAGGTAALAQPGSNASSLSASAQPDLRVYISGAVQDPGVYSLQPGDRLVDALEAAGGSAVVAHMTAVNLARRVQDEEYYYIPRIDETPPPVAASINGPTLLESDIASAGASNGLIDLNTATIDALTTLPGIGPVKAQAIVAYREQIGQFQSVDQITNVSGIGPATYEKIRGLITVNTH
jgi:competence protein ComEA